MRKLPLFFRSLFIIIYIKISKSIISSVEYNKYEFGVIGSSQCQWVAYIALQQFRKEDILCCDIHTVEGYSKDIEGLKCL